MLFPWLERRRTISIRLGRSSQPRPLIIPLDFLISRLVMSLMILVPWLDSELTTETGSLQEQGVAASLVLIVRPDGRMHAAMEGSNQTICGQPRNGQRPARLRSLKFCTKCKETYLRRPSK